MNGGCRCEAHPVPAWLARLDHHCELTHLSCVSALPAARGWQRVGEAVKRTARDWALLGTVWAELGAGRITEAFIRDGRSLTDGFVNGTGHITVNPAHQTIDTLIHEILHR